MPPSSPTTLAPAGQAAPVDHYENFPVASWLCPPALRPAVAALYHFARTADDLADEGEAPAAERLQALAAYEADLRACAAGQPVSVRWPQVFGPLAGAIARHRLPLGPMLDLLSAFSQDVSYTRDGRGYEDRAALLDYCRRSANPVGRLMLHLFGVDDPRALAESDDVCTALQLINFWQDLSVDLPRGRFYLPAEDCRRHGLDPQAPQGWAAHPAAPRLVADLCDWAGTLMRQGAGIAHRVPGRAGWELRAVVQGGLRVLDRIAAQGHDTFTRRPSLGATDAGVVAWRCVWMRPGPPHDPTGQSPMGQSRP